MTAQTTLYKTPAQKPPFRASDEATRDHLKLAKKQGDAFQEALEEMTQNVAQSGTEKPAGHYRVGYAVERPEGMYEVHNGQLKWHEPKKENIHIEISVRDGADGRFVPALDVQVTVLDADGKKVGSHPHPFLWHPWLYHYGRNWELPGDGEYTIRVHIDMPKFHRHDKTNGERYLSPVDVEFPNIPIEVIPPEK